MPRSVVALLLILLIALHLALALGRIDRVGITTDEVAHLTAGTTYWQNHDYRLQPENGNLPQRWAALPVLRYAPTFHPRTAPILWENSDVWILSDVFFFRSENPIRAMFRDARFAMSLWSAGLCGLVFAWSARRWGAGAGLFSAALMACNPTLLANGPLVTSDTVGAVTLLAATGAIWQALRRGGAGWISLSLVTTSLAFVAKFSCVLLVPIAVILAGLDAWLRRGEPRRPVARRLALLFGGHALAIVVTIWACFGFRYAAAGPDLPPLRQYYLPWEVLLHQGDVVTTLVDFARAHQLLPEAYLQGFAHVRYNAEARSAFLLGDYSITGWWWFFPATFLLKSTETELILTLALVVLAVRRVRRAREAGPGSPADGWSLAPLLVLGGVYGVTAVSSSLNIGHRHILLLYPLLFILAGGLVSATRPRWRPVWAVLPLGSFLAAASVAPHYLTYLNQPAGGPRHGWHKLVDSSLDWGQGLPELATWLETQTDPAERRYLTYFGSDDPAFRGIEATKLSWVYDHHRPQTFARLEPGLYCISASMMQMVFSPMRGTWSPFREAHYTRLREEWLPRIAADPARAQFTDLESDDPDSLWTLDQLRFNRLTQYLQVRGPDALVANCMLVFRLSEEEVRICEEGSVFALADLIESAAHRHD